MSLAISIVILLVLLLLTGVGAQRDLWRGALSLAGTLIGVVLTSLWANHFGQALVMRMKMDQEWALFFANVILLVGSAALLGYGGGVFLAQTTSEPSLQRRMVGGGIGLLNASIIIGYLLQFGVAANPNVAALISSSALAQFLYTGLPMIFLLLTLAASAAVAIKYILGKGARERPSTHRRRSNQAWVLERIEQQTNEHQ